MFSQPGNQTGSTRLPGAALMVGGIVLLAMAVLLSVRSQFLWNHAGASDRVLHTFVSMYVAAGLVYLLIIGRIRRMVIDRPGIAWIMLIGLLMRIVLLPSTPVLETDSFRYLWDGALSARGVNPYRYSPEEGRGSRTDDRGDPRLREAALDAGSTLDRINHREIRTIYPPVAQAAFLAAHWISPWSGTAWRAVLLAADVTTVLLLSMLLRQLRLPMSWIAIYWWNPLLIKEFFCAGHMDAVVLPLMVAALLMAIKHRPVRGAVCLAVAVAVKLWPIVLLPHLMRSLIRQPRRLGLALGAFGVAALFLLSPMIMAGNNGIAGMLRYSRAWQNNDGLFRLIVIIWQNGLLMVGLPEWGAQSAARATAAILLMAWIAWLIRRPFATALELCEAALLTVAALFLLSPTQFPWYYTWMLPLLALRPRWSLLIYTALLPLYHLHYRQSAWVWVEHVPVWGMLTSEFIWRCLRFGRGEPYAQEKLSNYEQSPIPTPV